MPTTTSSFVIKKPDNQSSTLETPPGSLDDFVPIIFPENLLSDKTYNNRDKTTPFMGFYVFVPSKATAVKEGDAFDDSSTNEITKLRGLNYADEVNKELNVKNGEEFVSKALQGNDRIRIFRKVNALKKFICLYMPDTVNHDLNAVYNNFNFGGDAVAAVSSLVDAVKTGAIDNSPEGVKNSLVNFIAAAGGQEGGIFSGLSIAARFAQQGAGLAVNPLSEMFFENMSFRQFNFDYKFTPKSPAEADIVKEIIKTFRMYSVPEITKENIAGVFFSVPAFFQIKYYMQQDGSVSENENIPKISGCVCTGVQTDWAPDGLALHKDGMPVAVRMQLNFTELEIMHRDRIKQGY
jgi:hypothetical protein